MKILVIFSALLLAVSANAENIHEVKKGDTLWDLSGQYYGDEWKWPVIWNGNAYVNNPDLIYPKEKLLIPGLPEGGENIRIGNNDIIKLTVDSNTIQQKELLESAHSRNSFNHQHLNGLTVVLDEKPQFSVISTEHDKVYSYKGERISIDGGLQQGIGEGDTVIIYGETGKLKDGRAVYLCAGYAKIVKAGDSTSEANVYTSFASIEKGYKAVKSAEYVVKKPKGFVKAQDSQIAGQIVHLADNHDFSAEGYYVIINVGRPSPVKEGDRFEIYRKVMERDLEKIESVGYGQIVMVNSNYSTMYIINSDLEIKKGDLVRLKDVGVF